jgi:hypothetical protein
MATFGNLETEVEPLASLMREHIEVHELVTATREAIEQALAEPGDAALAGSALEQLRDLDAYLAEDLVIHIAKEEDVLFPALRGFAADIDQVVDEMVEQHDEIRERQAVLERALAAMDDTHDEVDAARASISDGIRAAEANGVTVAALEALLDGVKRLDWILQGHFGDEEDDLFVPALELLSAETFAVLAEQAAAMG